MASSSRLGCCAGLRHGLAYHHRSLARWWTTGVRDHPRARPFLTGLLGLTRYAAEGDNEVRFTVGAGGGVKLMPVRRVGVRLDGRVFATFADIEGRVIACSPGVCLVALDTDIVWQAELTAGLVVAFP
jgi:hypothetical protein